MPRRARLHGVISFASVVVAGVFIEGCASNSDKGSSEKGAATSAAAADSTAYTMNSGGVPVLRLAAPAEAKCSLADGAFALKSREGYVNVWLVPGAATLEDGVARIPTAIASEFTDFSATSTAEFPGRFPAKRVMGSGREADDSDPGVADVIVFKAGAHVFIACTHGENLRASAQGLMASLVNSAATP